MKYSLKDRSGLYLVLVTLILLISNALLIYQNLQLRSSLESAKRLVTDVGYRFSQIPATNLDGEQSPMVFGQDGKRTILFVFNTNCEYCVQQYAGWKKLLSSIDRNQWKVYAVTSQTDVELIREHLSENGLMDVDVRVVPAEEVAKARIGFTPMTIETDADGVATKVYPGLWTKDFEFGK